MLLGQHCSMLSTILFGIVTPDCGLIQAQQYCSILLTTRNNVAPTTLLHPVFNNLLQLIIFCRVVSAKPMLKIVVSRIRKKGKSRLKITRSRILETKESNGADWSIISNHFRGVGFIVGTGTVYVAIMQKVFIPQESLPSSRDKIFSGTYNGIICSTKCFIVEHIYVLTLSCEIHEHCIKTKLFHTRLWIFNLNLERC